MIKQKVHKRVETNPSVFHLPTSSILHIATKLLFNFWCFLNDLSSFVLTSKHVIRSASLAEKWDAKRPYSLTNCWYKSCCMMKLNFLMVIDPENTSFIRCLKKWSGNLDMLSGNFCQHQQMVAYVKLKQLGKLVLMILIATGTNIWERYLPNYLKELTITEKNWKFSKVQTIKQLLQTRLPKYYGMGFGSTPWRQIRNMIPWLLYL